jgi:hypothetical protein
MGKKGSDDSVSKGIAGVIVGVIVLIAVVPKPVWIFLGIVTAAAIVIGGAATSTAQQRRPRRR